MIENGQTDYIPSFNFVAVKLKSKQIKKLLVGKMVLNLVLKCKAGEEKLLINFHHERTLG